MTTTMVYVGTRRLAFASSRGSLGLCNRMSTRHSSNTMQRSINVEEVAKFNQVGADWWKTSSRSGTGPLHAMNPTRVEFIRSALGSAKLALGEAAVSPMDEIRGLEILDVGCGGGLLSEALARLGAKVTGIDPAAESIRVASLHSRGDWLTANVAYKHSTIEEMEASGHKFDVVCSLEVLEHVEMPLAFIASCSNCLKPGGSLFFSTINRTAKSYLMTILGAEYVMRLLPVGTHDWNKFITPQELTSMVNTIGRVEKINGIVLNPPTTCFDLSAKWSLHEKDLDVNYIMHAVKPET